MHGGNDGRGVECRQVNVAVDPHTAVGGIGHIGPGGRAHAVDRAGSGTAQCHCRGTTGRGCDRTGKHGGHNALLRQGRDGEVEHGVGRVGALGHRRLGHKGFDAVGRRLRELLPLLGVRVVLAQDQIDRLAVFVSGADQIGRADVFVNLVGTRARCGAQAHHLAVGDARRFVGAGGEVDGTGVSRGVVSHVIAGQRHANGRTHAGGTPSTHANGGRNDGGLDAVVGFRVHGDIVTGRDGTVVHTRQGIAQDHVERRRTCPTDAHAGSTTHSDRHRCGQAKHLNVCV